MLRKIYKDAFGDKLNIGDVVGFTGDGKNKRMFIGIICLFRGEKTAMMYTNESHTQRKTMTKNCVKVTNEADKIHIIQEYIKNSLSLNYPDFVEEFEAFINTLKFKEI